MTNFRHKFTSIHVIDLINMVRIQFYCYRTPIDPPTYENIDLSNCPPPLLPKSKPTTPISPKHVEIEHKFFPDSGIPPLFEGKVLHIVYNQRWNHIAPS